ncbi:hypothetical protein S40293_04718 [Stachybotrys chartarum IBT 40293]|nr:hypothetical protein S40293_04718 [Stachybotrys chartarum IBT 40293]
MGSVASVHPETMARCIIGPTSARRNACAINARADARFSWWGGGGGGCFWGTRRIKGQKLVSASRDGAILVSNPRIGETVAKLDCNTHKKFFHLGVTPDSSVVVSIWGDTVNRWNWLTSDLDAYPASLRRGREGRPIALSPDCRFLACTNTEGVDISDLHTGRCLHAIRFQTGIVTAAAFSVDGTYLALGKVGLTTSRAIAKPTLDIWNLVF